MYNNSTDKIRDILEVWKIIEYLTPPASEKYKEYLENVLKVSKGNNRNNEGFEYKINEDDSIFLIKDTPYTKSQGKNIYREGYHTYFYWHIYFGYFNWTKTEIAIKNKLNNNDIEPDNIKTTNNFIVTPLWAFILDENGKLKLDSIKISTAAWVSGKILDPKFDIDKLENFLSFNMDTVRITQLIASQCGEINDEGIVSFNNQNPNTVFDLEQPTQEIKLNLANITKLTKIIAEALNIKDEFLEPVFTI